MQMLFSIFQMFAPLLIKGLGQWYDKQIAEGKLTVENKAAMLQHIKDISPALNDSANISRDAERQHQQALADIANIKASKK